MALVADFWRSRDLLGQLDDFLAGTASWPLEELKQLLYALKPVLINPLEFPRPDEAAKREVESGKVFLDKEYKINPVFVQQALELSSVLNLNEFVAVELLRVAQQQSWRYADTDSYLVALSDGFDVRQCRLLAVRSLLTAVGVGSAVTVPPAVLLVLQQLVAELIEGGLVGNLLSWLRLLLADVGAAQPQRAPTAASTQPPPELIDWKRREAALIAQCVVEAVGTAVGRWPAGAASDLLQTLADALKLPGVMVPAVSSTAAASAPSGAAAALMLRTAEPAAPVIDDAAAAAASVVDGISGWAFEVVGRLLLAWRALLEPLMWPQPPPGVPAAQAPRIDQLLATPWPHRGLHAAASLGWALAQLQLPSLLAADRPPSDALLAVPLSNGGLGGWRLVTEHAKGRWPDSRLLAVSVGHGIVESIVAAGPAVWMPDGPHRPPLLLPQLLTLAAVVYQDEPELLASIRTRESVDATDGSSSINSAAAINSISISCWPSPLLAEFVRDGAAVAVAEPASVFVPYLHLLGALCSDSEGALCIYRLLSPASAELPALFGWAHWFAALQNVLHDLSSQAAPAAGADGPSTGGTGRGGPVTVRGAHVIELAQAERDGLQAILDLVARVARYLDGPVRFQFGMARDWQQQQPAALAVLSGQYQLQLQQPQQPPAAVHTLLGVLGCPLPASFKAAAVRALRQLARSRSLALVIWRQLSADGHPAAAAAAAAYQQQQQQPTIQQQQLHQTSSSMQSLLAGLRLELDDDEPTAGDYPYTVAWLKLLRALLVALPPTAAGSALPALFTFFKDVIWLKSDSRYYASNAVFDRWAVAKHCLKLFQQVLSDSVLAADEGASGLNQLPSSISAAVLLQQQLPAPRASCAQLSWASLAAAGPHGMLAKLHQLILLPFGRTATAATQAAGLGTVQLSAESGHDVMERVAREPAWHAVILLALQLLDFAVRHESAAADIQQQQQQHGAARTNVIGAAVLGMPELVGAVALMVGWAQPLPAIARAALRLVDALSDETLNWQHQHGQRRLAAILSAAPLLPAVIGAFRTAFEATMFEQPHREHIDGEPQADESLAGLIVGLLERHAARPYASLTHLLLGWPWPDGAPATEWRLERAAPPSVLHALLDALNEDNLPQQRWLPDAFRLLATLTEHKSTRAALLRHLLSSGTLNQQLRRVAATEVSDTDSDEAVPRLRIALSVLQMAARAVLSSGVAARDTVEALYRPLEIMTGGGGSWLLCRLLDAIDVPELPSELPRGPAGEDFTSEAFRAQPTPELALQIDLAAVLRLLTESSDASQQAGAPGPIMAACAAFNRRCARGTLVVRCVTAWRDLLQVSLPLGLKVFRELGDATAESIWELLDVALLPRIQQRTTRPEVAAVLAAACLHAVGAVHDVHHSTQPQDRALSVLQQVGAALARDSTPQAARTSLCGALIDLVHMLLVPPGGHRFTGPVDSAEASPALLADVQRILRRHGDQIVRKLAELMRQQLALPTQALAAATLQVLVELDEALPYAGAASVGTWAEAVARVGVVPLLLPGVQSALPLAARGIDVAASATAAYFFDAGVSLLNALAARVPVSLVQIGVLRAVVSSAAVLDLPLSQISTDASETEGQGGPDERFFQLAVPVLRLLLTLLTAAPKNVSVIDEVIRCLDVRAELISTILRDRVRGSAIRSDSMTAVELLTALLARLLHATPGHLPSALGARWPVWLGHLAQLFSKYSADRWLWHLQPPLANADAVVDLSSHRPAELAQARQICNNVLAIARLSADPGQDVHNAEVAPRLLFPVRTIGDFEAIVGYLRTLLISRPVTEAAAQQISSKLDSLQQLTGPELNELLVGSNGVTFDTLAVPPVQKQHWARNRLAARLDRVVADLQQINYGIENALVVFWFHVRVLEPSLPASKLEPTSGEVCQLRKALWTMLEAAHDNRPSVSGLLEQDGTKGLIFMVFRQIRAILKV
eukprot:TRINITY_DN2246_c0_g2_i2.p1 TRINITY_DN2246_c0_g2~~TRINITY_DN2246_c0_g2_i2.p1  ORF type:complete len:1952 (+),score=433.37 TRINITY_DN2246_c0_g2_i2:70-5925(+)